MPTPPGAKFELLPVGATLPSDADCAARVRRGGSEVRAKNNTANHTVGAVNSTYPRSTGNFTGTTDEIIQWAACKWGFPEDLLRAQVAKESYWTQYATGDWTGDAANCAPGHGIGVDGRPGQCPESMGLMQVRTQYFRDSINNAIASSAYNLDVSLAVWRNCFEGRETWLNDVDRGSQYAAGDMWGCVGRWFAGRWHTAPAEQYITAVKDYLNQRIWETPGFINYNG